MCLDEVDCDLKYSGLRRKVHVIASYCEDLQRKNWSVRRKIRVHELIRGSLVVSFSCNRAVSSCAGNGLLIRYP